MRNQETLGRDERFCTSLSYCSSHSGHDLNFEQDRNDIVLPPFNSIGYLHKHPVALVMRETRERSHRHAAAPHLLRV